MDLTLKQIAVLAVLTRHRDVSQVALFHLIDFRVQKINFDQMIARLEVKGLIAKFKIRGSRTNRLRLTPEGRSAIGNARAIVRKLYVERKPNRPAGRRQRAVAR